MNRGENLKVLSVKLDVPVWVLTRLKDFCRRQWLSRGLNYPLRSRMVDLSIEDAYTRLSKLTCSNGFHTLKTL